MSCVIDWVSHPSDSTVDVCVARFQLTPELDHLVFPMAMGVTQEVLSSDRFTLGHELFIAGLFQHHHGTNRNIPIVRVGNVACMTEERVRTMEMGEIEAYLVEARSIGGLSGSPVFLYLGAVRTKPVVFEVKKMHLLGLVHGHFDESDAKRDAKASKSASQVNAGIALVVPFHHIASVIEFAEASWAMEVRIAN